MPNEQPPETERLLSMQETAERWGIHVATVKRMIDANDIPHVKIGHQYRISSTFIDEAMRHGTAEANRLHQRRQDTPT